LSNWELHIESCEAEIQKTEKLEGLDGCGAGMLKGCLRGEELTPGHMMGETCGSNRSGNAKTAEEWKVISRTAKWLEKAS